MLKNQSKNTIKRTVPFDGGWEIEGVFVTLLDYLMSL